MEKKPKMAYKSAMAYFLILRWKCRTDASFAIPVGILSSSQTPWESWHILADGRDLSAPGNFQNGKTTRFAGSP